MGGAETARKHLIAIYKQTLKINSSLILSSFLEADCKEVGIRNGIFCCVWIELHDTARIQLLINNERFEPGSGCLVEGKL